MSFVKDRHVRYWRMCARSLPDHYVSNDSSRMTLGCFIVSALDLLGVLDEVDVDERQSWVAWIYACQVSEGGFRGFTGTDLRDLRSSQNNHLDPANIPATFFALTTLLVLGDDLSRVKRQECLSWLPKLQREDGSFGELLSEHGIIEGDRDLRQCCCAAGIAYILKGQEQESPILDSERLLAYVQSCQSSDGGFGTSPLRESHAGLSYCAIATLAFLRKLEGQHTQDAWSLIPYPDQCLRWFLDRQTNVIDEDDGEDGEPDGQEMDKGHDSRSQQNANQTIFFPPGDTSVAGFNGRDSKLADTCYAFWNTGALAVLKKEDLVDADPLRKYLLEVTQHRIGGFGKGRDDPPDILHSYLGLAALALFNQPEVKALDPTMCISLAAISRLGDVKWKLAA